MSIKTSVFGVPTILIVIGFILIVLGTSQNDELTYYGWLIILFGILIQFFGIFRRRV